jgi:hypothetical protein
MKKWIVDLFFEKESLFIEKRSLRKNAVLKGLVIIISAVVIALLFLPEKRKEVKNFHEKVESINVDEYGGKDNNPNQSVIKQVAQSFIFDSSTSTRINLNDLYRKNSGVKNLGSSGNSNPEKSMIILQNGDQSKNQLPPGTKIMVKLSEKMIIGKESVPVIAIVVKDFVVDTVAVPEGSKIIGDVAFDESTERAMINWRSIIFPDGRERQFSAIAVGLDGQLGIEGKVRSDAVKNALGQTLTKFVGAYAEGSITRSTFGASMGGHSNGIRQAIAETVTDQASDTGQDMQKERSWIEIEYGAQSYAVLNQNFVFKDPGAITYGN